MSAWKEIAKTLAFGRKRKIVCCGSSPSAYVNNSEKGISMYCFRCGTKDFEPHTRLSAADYLRMRQADASEAVRGAPDTLPLYSEGVPASARLWVLRAGLQPERASDVYGFGWSERTERVIVPLLHNTEPTGLWTGRDATPSKHRPKYISARGAIGGSWYSKTLRELVVVTEDILSAIRVSEAGYGSIAVLGTSVGAAQAMLLADHPVVGWFDNDKAGRDGYIKLRKALAPYGVEPKRIQSDRDPKDHSKAEIQAFIEG